MDKNDSSKLKRLYEIEEGRFLERRRRHEEAGHLMDVHQFYLEDILLKREELFYKYCPSRRKMEDKPVSTEASFDYAFLEKNAGSIGWHDIKAHQSEPRPKGACVEESSVSIEMPRKELKSNRLSARDPKASRVYVCEITGCNKKYTSSFGLKYHIREGHSEEKMSVHKPYVCPFRNCDKKYKNNNGLKYHMRNFHGQEASL
jgi:uncharacterized Zn-finger protein